MQVNDELSLIVLNGVISAARNDAVEFVPVLDAIRGIGKEIHQVFSHSVEELAHTVLHSRLEELVMLAQAELWILWTGICMNTPMTVAGGHTIKSFRSYYDNQTQKNSRKQRKELAYINDLYTVYSNIYLYDKAQRILCCARDTTEQRQQMPDNSGSADCLLLNSPHQYAVSDFEPSALYKQQSTYIYHAPVFTNTTSAKAQGGIALVFDSAPQFSAMLLDILPKNEHGK